jgi:DNA ligase (NAD+)
VGEHVAELLAGHFTGIESLMNAAEEDLVFKKATKDLESTGIKGVGPEIGGSIVSFFEDEANIRRVRRLLDAGIQFEVSPESSAVSEVSDKSFVLTGTLSTMSRSEARDLIHSQGGRVVSSISNRTHYLVRGDEPGSKLQKARELGTNILDEKAFLILLGKPNE